MAIRFLIVVFFMPYSLWASCIAGEISFTPFDSPTSHLDKGSQYARVELADGWESARAVVGPKLLGNRRDVEAKTNLDPIGLVLRQVEFFRLNYPNLAMLMDRFARREVGVIEEAGCLETMLLEKHFEGNATETEFFAMVMTKDGKSIAHVVTWGELGVYLSPKYASVLKKDIEDGWLPYINMHNHPFVLSNFPNDIAGTLTPSHPDADLYVFQMEKWGLAKAWITNGFHTAKFTAAEFPRLRSHGFSL